MLKKEGENLHGRWGFQIWQTENGRRLIVQTRLKELLCLRDGRIGNDVAIIAAATATTTTNGFGHSNLLLKDSSFFTCLDKRNCSAMEGVAFASFTSFATKSLLVSSLSPSSIITHRQKSRKNTLKTISHRNLVIRASSASSSGSVVKLLDYGAGNVRSLRNAICYLGFEIEDVRAPKNILNADRLIFPGVGAFASAMDVLVKTGMDEALCTYIRNDRPFLGICLGLQLLFEYSEENGPVKGLGLIPGVVGRFNSSNGFRVPHIGWNALQIAKDSEILDEIGDRHVSSSCNYGCDFIASIRRGNVHGVQFHPEKSGGKIFYVGLSVLRRFLHPNSWGTKSPTQGKASKLPKRVRVSKARITLKNDKGDLVVTKGDQHDVREQTKENEMRNLGKPVELSGRYYKDGADEVSFLNITGFRDFPLGDLPMLQVKTGKSSLEQISRVYGNQAVVVSIDPGRVYVKSPNDVKLKTIRVRKPGSNREVYAWYQCTVNGRREGRPIGAYELAKAVEELGAGEILLNCIDCDGQGKGFDILINLISDAVSIPVIASSGAGAVKHFSEVFTKANASAALAAGIFHRKEVPIQSVKGHLLKEGIEMSTLCRPMDWDMVVPLLALMLKVLSFLGTQTYHSKVNISAEVGGNSPIQIDSGNFGCEIHTVSSGTGVGIWKTNITPLNGAYILLA
ncbi:hypothetical protein J1N35_036951 [Gossypium stocksii]|uniref:Glutamine amidotransferase domain-containing protein n=1 Tax=Gossypium stocksii TaxID=47602 RepID=A0A9D3UJ10_9ROSI|nr:hypothetical protein J1N35_036951 [Gossypium stocksii]